MCHAFKKRIHVLRFHKTHTCAGASLPHPVVESCKIIFYSATAHIPIYFVFCSVNERLIMFVNMRNLSAYVVIVVCVALRHCPINSRWLNVMTSWLTVPYHCYPAGKTQHHCPAKTFLFTIHNHSIQNGLPTEKPLVVHIHKNIFTSQIFPISFSEIWKFYPYWLYTATEFYCSNIGSFFNITSAEIECQSTYYCPRQQL